MPVPARLSGFPHSRVRIGCPVCPRRRGDYATARLLQRFGAEVTLHELLWQLTQGCRYQVPPETRRRPYVPYCRACFLDLQEP